MGANVIFNLQCPSAWGFCRRNTLNIFLYGNHRDNTWYIFWRDKVLSSYLSKKRNSSCCVPIIKEHVMEMHVGREVAIPHRCRINGFRMRD